MSKITQLQGETAYDAFLQHNALDIEDEQSFLDWCELNDHHDIPHLATPYVIQDLYEKFLQEQRNLSR